MLSLGSKSFAFTKGPLERMAVKSLGPLPFLQKGGTRRKKVAEVAPLGVASLPRSPPPAFPARGQVAPGPGFVRCPSCGEAKSTCNVSWLQQLSQSRPQNNPIMEGIGWPEDACFTGEREVAAEVARLPLGVSQERAASLSPPPQHSWPAIFGRARGGYKLRGGGLWSSSPGPSGAVQRASPAGLCNHTGVVKSSGELGRLKPGRAEPGGSSPWAVLGRASSGLTKQEEEEEEAASVHSLSPFPLLPAPPPIIFQAV